MELDEVEKKNVTPQPITPEFLRIDGAIVFTGLSRSTIRKLARNGKIKTARAGRAVRFPIDSLREFLNANTR